MFSIGKTDPRLYKRTFASAGMSWVVVTNTLTQLLLWDAETADAWGRQTYSQHPPYGEGLHHQWAPGADDGQGLERVREPGVGERLHLCSELQPCVSLSWAEQTWKGARVWVCSQTGPSTRCMLSRSHRGCLTPHIVFVHAIQFFDSSVAEGQFPHPVDPAADTRSQAQVGAGCSCMEAISCKTVSTVDNNDMFYLKNLLWWKKKDQRI